MRLETFPRSSLGMSKTEIKRQVQGELNKHADILIGLDDPELNLLIDALIQAITDTVSANNAVIAEQLQKTFDRGGY